jgi:hypothetical protein
MICEELGALVGQCGGIGPGGELNAREHSSF